MAESQHAPAAQPVQDADSENTQVATGTEADASHSAPENLTDEKDVHNTSHPTSNVVHEAEQETEKPAKKFELALAARHTDVHRSQLNAQNNDGKVELKEKDAFDKLGFSFPTWKKWMILSVIFMVQVSMNWNASLYANAVDQISEQFSITKQKARVGQAIFLIAYALGSELWAPWSEELGRWPVLQVSLLFVNIWQIPCALAKNFTTIAICRALAGLSSAGGSVTLGMVADMWDPEEQQYAVAFIVFSSVGGSVVGPIAGGFIQTRYNWHWNFWIQLIVGVSVQIVHAICVPETRVAVLLDRQAKKRRAAGDKNIYGPGELEKNKFAFKKILTIWTRPFVMFVTEPIVLFLSLLSGFSDALIFTFLESYSPVFSQWGFSTEQVGLAFFPLLIGYFIAWGSFIPFIRRDRQVMKSKGADALQPEKRLYWLLYTAPLETIGLIGFAWTSLGPAYHIPWIAPLLFSILIAIANYAIYMATIDYMIASYGPYSASATGGNALARDFLAGVAAMYATPFYSNLPAPYSLEKPTSILACLAFTFTIPIYVFYKYGPQIRSRSKFAQQLSGHKKTQREGSTPSASSTSTKKEKGDSKQDNLKQDV